MMAEHARPTDPQAARSALDFANASARAGARRGVPPRWIGVGMSLTGVILWSLNSLLEDGYLFLVTPFALAFIFGWSALMRGRSANGRLFWGDMGWRGWTYMAVSGALLAFGVWGDLRGFRWSMALAGLGFAIATQAYYEIVRGYWIRGRRWELGG